MNSIKVYLQNPSLVIYRIVYRLRYCFSDKLYLKILFRIKMGYKLNLKNPQTFSEKIQWLKLYDRKPEYTNLVDKYEVKSYVANVIGNKYIIPTLGVWEKPEDIEWDKLPNKFVLKTTHGGGSNGVIICKNKDVFDRYSAVLKLKRSLAQDIYWSLREWPYKNVCKRVIAEQFIGDEKTDLKDYKFFCFNGVPQLCQVIGGRGNKMTVDFFDMNWKHQSFHEPKIFPFADVEPQCPSCLSKMVDFASRLSKGHPFLRVDFYEISGNIKFGELTFFSTSGYGGFFPEFWDKKIGEMIHLDK